jgi:hypothetical protein
VAEHVKGGASSPEPTQSLSTAPTECAASTSHPAGRNPQCFYLKLYHRVNNCCNYEVRLYNSMIDDKDGHMLSPMFMFTCTMLRHALQERQKKKGVHPKATQSQLSADRPDRSNYLNHRNNSCTIASCCAAMGPTVVTSPGVANT